MQDMHLSKQHREDLIALCESLKTKSPEDAVSINNIIQFIRDQKFETKKKIMLEVVSAYGPTFMELNEKNQKKEVKKIIEKYDIPKWTFWRMCTSYFQRDFKITLWLMQNTLPIGVKNKDTIEMVNYQKRK